MLNSKRRPISSRETNWAKRTANYLTKKKVKPNSISICSLIFAFCAAASLVLSTHYIQPLAHALTLFGTVIFIVLRLLCNLFDGMVAIEGGAGTKTGELFNDAPDRPADIFILVAAGYAAQCMTLGWLAAILAVLTAYIRLLGQSLGTKPYFIGPMAKQHRMAVMICACLLAIPVGVSSTAIIMTLALIIISLGAFVTIIRRLQCIAKDLET